VIARRSFSFIAGGRRLTAEPAHRAARAPGACILVKVIGCSGEKDWATVTAIDIQTAGVTDIWAIQLTERRA
jgi:hypothetical protein